MEADRIRPALDRRPIFVLGMLPRTGTNYLRDLLTFHPDVVPLEPVHEDHLLRWSDHLVAYVDDVSRCWDPTWGVPDSERAALLQQIGGGIERWLSARAPGSCIVTKMPSVERLGNFASLFAGCPLIIVVRDGRSVTESGVKSFGWTYERGMRRWVLAAREVLAFDSASPDRCSSHRIVRYEDLMADPERVLRPILEYCGLDPDRYDFELARHAPVRGSSTLRSEQSTDLHWRPVERPADFSPLDRWRKWDDRRHSRFAEVAGAEQRALGYGLVEPVGYEANQGDRARDMVDQAAVRWRETRVVLGRLQRAGGRVLRTSRRRP